MDNQPNPQNQPTPTEPAGSPPITDQGTPAPPAPGMISPTQVPEGTGAPVPVPPPSPKGSPKKLLIILGVILLLAIAGIAAWYFIEDSKDPVSQPSTESVQQENIDGDDEQVTAGYKKTTYTDRDGNTATVEHPESWLVVNTTDEMPGEELVFKETTIGSPAGHYLHLFEVDGIGGTCDPDDITYTLTKKLSTATPGVYFTQYSAKESEYDFIEKLKIESYDTAYVTDAHKNLKEGESGTDVCSNLPGYSSYGVFVTLTDKSDRSGLSPTLSYADIEKDTEFVKMLQSLYIVSKE